MAILRKIHLKHGFIQVPNQTVRASYTSISLQAVGLLVDLMSYPEDWELHKTEVYQRYAKNKRTSVKSAWDELVKENYIIEFKVRQGRKWEYFYYVRLIPFTKEENKTLYNQAIREFGSSLHWDVDFQQSNMDSPKTTYNKYNTKQKQKQINIIDDDITSVNQLTYSEEELNIIIKDLRKLTKNELTTRSFNAVLRIVKDKYLQGKIKISFREYFMKALNKKIEELEERRIKEKAKQELNYSRRNIVSTPYTGKVPIYNWLEEDR
ncbi:hypothetical protein DN407_31245 (plasmid) [Bacillus sp. JAS24-2]|uniref:hypothetical protein n=1 Tax=Bacillus sp. JAS24-2 TaxID=2217832 RepID=UPI0011EE4BD2|nr:hypothetical protein [Bacillus sp. JAS24-2]QEL82880.1 hypothetical protein DN407_31245 [Bacillus sp. JAS24-2]